MRIGFIYTFSDQQWLGGKNYFSNLFKAIHSAAAGSVDLVVITGTKTDTALADEFPFLEMVRTSMLDRPSFLGAWRSAARRLAPGQGRDPALSSLVRKLGVDVLSHASPMHMSGIKTLGWLPDFQFMHLPHNWTPKQLRVMQKICRDACQYCDAVLVSSKSALDDLQTFARDSPAKKYVLRFAPSVIDLSALPELPSLRARYELPEDYLHLPNQFWAHKNHRLVVDALAALARRGVTPTVVCTGSTVDLRSPQFFESLMMHCRQVGVEQQFRTLGVVPYGDMQSLMLHARAVLNPSRFEGWSTSVEEAKSFDKLVLLSGIRVHREQAPRHAIYFDPDSPEQLADVMQQALAMPRRVVDADVIVSRSQQRLREFGLEYLNVVSQVAEQRTPQSF